MANTSKERQIIAGLTGQAMQKSEVRDQPPLDATRVSRLLQEWGAQLLFLQKTEFIYPGATYTETDGRPGRPDEQVRNVGHKTIAIFAETDVPINRGGDPITHHQAHLGLWLRKPTPTELESLDYLDPRHAWIFEALAPVTGMPHTVEPTGIVSEVYVPEAL